MRKLIGAYIKRNYDILALKINYSYILSPITNYIFWAVWIIILVIIADKTEIKFLQNSAKQSVGADIWNLIGTVGIITLPLVIIFPRAIWVRWISHNFFSSAFYAGALACGYFLGYFILGFIKTDVYTCKTWMNITFYIVSLAYFIFLNGVLLYFSYLVEPKDNNKFIQSLMKTSLIFRFLLAICITIVISMGLIASIFLGSTGI